MVNGSKETSEKIFFKTLKSVQKDLRKKNFEEILKVSLINSSPTAYMKRTQRKRKRTTEFPFLLKSKTRISYGIKFLIQSSRKSLQNSFYKTLKTELINSSNKKSLSFKRKTDIHKEVFLKKKFANFRWF
jgi:small subunit ribosomal protein S7